VWQPGVAVLQKQLRHTAGVYALVATLYQEARKANDRILWCESHMQAARRYYYRGAWHNFRPDATVLYEQREGETRTRWLLWLEWDGATMSRSQLREKLQAYASYVRSREWRRFGISDGKPVLLVVTPERGQADLLRELAIDILAETPMQMYIALRSLFEAQGVVAPIWYQAVPPVIPAQWTVLKKVFGDWVNTEKS
jgi:hypothetical protein